MQLIIPIGNMLCRKEDLIQLIERNILIDFEIQYAIIDMHFSVLLVFH